MSALVFLAVGFALGFAAGLRRSGVWRRLCARNAALAEDLDASEHARWVAKNDATRWKLRALRHGWKRDR